MRKFVKNGDYYNLIDLDTNQNCMDVDFVYFQKTEDISDYVAAVDKFEDSYLFTKKGELIWAYRDAQEHLEVKDLIEIIARKVATIEEIKSLDFKLDPRIKTAILERHKEINDLDILNTQNLNKKGYLKILADLEYAYLERVFIRLEKQYVHKSNIEKRKFQIRQKKQKTEEKPQEFKK